MMDWQTLAPELIFEILSKVPSLPGLMTLPVIKPGLFPWYLGHVCSSWRAVFQSSPRFWSALIIDLEHEGNRVKITPYHMERALLLTEMCLRKSKSHPLSFQFKFNGLPYRDDHRRAFQLSPCHKMLKAMMAHSTRWLDAYFYLSYREVSMLSAVKTQLPILRAFRLTCYYDYFDENRPQFGNLFEDTSQVKRACISHCLAWNLNWSSITTIHLHFTEAVQPELLIKFLQRMERLEDLYLDVYIDQVALFGSLPRITLPSLRCLGTSSMASLFFFETPVLEDLYIHTFSDVSDAQVTQAVSKMLGQPLSHLKRLVLRLFHTKMGTVISQYLPDTIQDISIYVWDDHVSNLRILSSCPAAARLETITVGLACSYGASHFSKLLTILKFWTTQSVGTTGFGRFEGLKHFVLELESGVSYNQGVFDRFESQFTRIFSERGVRCSIRYIHLLDDYGGVPPFDIFGA